MVCTSACGGIFSRGEVEVAIGIQGENSIGRLNGLNEVPIRRVEIDVRSILVADPKAMSRLGGYSVFARIWMVNMNCKRTCHLYSILILHCPDTDARKSYSESAQRDRQVE